MKLSLVILNYKSFDAVHECLTAIQKFPPSAEYEIIVVDNFSQQDAEEKKFLAEWSSKIQYLKNDANLGFGRGADSGFSKAKGEYLVLMNPDVSVWEHAFDEGLEYLEAHKEVGILGGQLRYPSGVIQDSYRRFPRLFDQFIKRVGFLRSHRSLRKRVSSYLMWGKDPEKTELVDWVVGGFMFIRKKAYQEIGGFDKRYFLFMEDVDICRQMWKHGYHVMYHPAVKATHASNRLSSGGIVEFFTKYTVRIHFRSALQYFWKYKTEKLPR